MRQTGMDLLRVVGIAAVVLGHVYAGPATHQWVYPWHVPVFFFLTGYFWKPNRSIGEEFRNRARTLLLPYLTWLLVGFAVVAVMGRFGPDVVVRALKGGVTFGGVFGAFWFVMALFFTAMLYRILERFPAPVGWVIAGAGLTIAYLFPRLLAETPQSIGLAAPCLIYVIAGHFARNHQPTRPALTGTIALGAVALVVQFAPISTVALKPANFGTPVIGVLLSITACWGLTLLFSRAPAPKVVTELALCGIAVVLFHTAVISVAGDAPRPLVAVAALVIPWVLALLLRRTPLSLVTTGQPRGKGLR